LCIEILGSTSQKQVHKQ